MRFIKFSKTQACPLCHSKDVYRLKRQGLANRIVSKFSDYRPHWCSNCDEFFYAPKRPKTIRIEGTYGMSQQANAQVKRHADGLSH